MNCTFCGQALSVHVLDPGEGFRERLYCPSCRAFQNMPDDSSCLFCGAGFRHFVATGRLGCAHCYDAFADRLEPLVASYRGEAADPESAGLKGTAAAGIPAAEYKPDRLARARSEELSRLVRDAPGLSPELLAGDRPEHAEATENGSPESAADPASAPDDAAALSVRLRVARNFVGLPYRLNAAQTAMLDQVLLAHGSSLRSALPRGTVGRVPAESELERLRQNGDLPPAARLAAPIAGWAGPAWLYTGDEDHLRLQWRTRLPGDVAQPALMANLVTQIAAVLADMRQIDEVFAVQHHPRHGFLTACPGIGGAAVRLSFQLSIRGLVEAGLWPEYERRLGAHGLEVRGARGEDGRLAPGEPADWNTVQISNRFWPADADRPEIERIVQIVSRLAGMARHS